MSSSQPRHQGVKTLLLATGTVLALAGAVTVWRAAENPNPRRVAPYQACERAISAATDEKLDFGMHRHRQYESENGEWVVFGQYSSSGGSVVRYQCVATPDVPGEYRVMWWRS